MSLVKESKTIKEALLKRLREVYPQSRGQGFSGSKVVKDAEERGFKIVPGCLSRYFKGDSSSILSEEQIIWLSIRYGIPLQLTVGINVIKDDKIVTEIPKYNESKSLQLLRQIFSEKV